MSQYSSKLRDPRWQKKRLEIFEAAGWKCQECDAETKELHAHHMIYRRGKNPWEYSQKEIIALCSDCHEKIGTIQEHISEAIINITSISHWEPVRFNLIILGFIDGISAQARSENSDYKKAFISGMQFDHSAYAEYKYETTLRESKATGANNE